MECPLEEKIQSIQRMLLQDGLDRVRKKRAEWRAKLELAEHELRLLDQQENTYRKTNGPSGG